MKKLLVLAACFICCACAMADDDFRCLASVGTKKPIRLQFTFPPDNSDLGRVVYQGGSGAIEVKRLKERTLREVANGRPWVFESRWAEMVKNGEGGTYVMVTQGALIDSFKYIRKKDNKVFKFRPDPDAEGDDGCIWNKRAQSGN